MLDYATFISYAEQCAPAVHPETMGHLVKRESSFNPYAIAVIGGTLQRQPKNLSEAVATAQALQDKGIRFSAGLAQIYVGNFAKYSLDVRSVFDICKNLSTGSKILVDCGQRAYSDGHRGQAVIEKAFSCYYSNNFTTGFKHGYVQKIIASAYEARMRKGLAR